MTVAGGVAVSQALPLLVLTGEGAEGALTLPAFPPCRGHGGSRMEAWQHLWRGGHPGAGSV